jgi:hypothetical protein
MARPLMCVSGNRGISRGMEATDMRAWILVGSLAAATGAAACGTQAAAPFGATGQAMVQCEPGQHAVVNQSVADGRTLTSVSCAADAPVFTRTQPRGSYRAPAAVAYQPQPVYQPEAVYQPQPVTDEPAPVSRPAVVHEEAPAVAQPPAAVEDPAPTRSWQKRAIVIGGSSGAGAGIGALIGGKKGALIGAAIGGGAGTIYEMRKK